MVTPHTHTHKDRCREAAYGALLEHQWSRSPLKNIDVRAEAGVTFCVVSVTSRDRRVCSGVRHDPRRVAPDVIFGVVQVTMQVVALLLAVLVLVGVESHRVAVAEDRRRQVHPEVGFPNMEAPWLFRSQSNKSRPILFPHVDAGRGRSCPIPRFCGRGRRGLRSCVAKLVGHAPWKGRASYVHEESCQSSVLHRPSLCHQKLPHDSPPPPHGEEFQLSLFSSMTHTMDAACVEGVEHCSSLSCATPPEALARVVARIPEHSFPLSSSPSLSCSFRSGIVHCLCLRCQFRCMSGINLHLCCSTYGGSLAYASHRNSS